MKAGASRLLGLAALGALGAAVWVVGPMVGFAGLRPLASPWLRGGLIAAIALAVVLSYAWRFAGRRRAEKRLQAVLSGPLSERDSEGLDGRMAEAVAAFRARSPRHNPLRTLPWYVVLGPKGAGKTTALHRAGLTLPPGATPVEGVRPTEFCDWWFADEAVLVDTAGRYTAHRADTPSDRAAWLALLALLLRNRPRQPINGVILVFSLEDMMALDDAGIEAHLAVIRARLGEIAGALRTRFPVYVLFTKADLVAGFSEYFVGLDAREQSAVWGAMLPAGSGEPQALAEFEALTRRLAGALPERLDAAPDFSARRLAFAFPQQFERLGARVARFLSAVGQPGAGDPAPHALRGFWFSSARREGRPFDLIGGTPARVAAVAQRDTADGFFLDAFLPAVVLADKGWVARRSPPGRRAAASRAAGLGLIGFVTAAGLVALGTSFAANHALIRSLDAALAGSSAQARALLAADTVRDADLESIVGALTALRDLPAGFDEGDRPVPLWEGFGLSERPRLRSAARTAYAQALERLFRTRLLMQLEAAIGAGLREPAAIYDPLKIYLMLGGEAPRTDASLISAWFRRDWERRYPGAVNGQGRERLAEHLDAMLALGDPRPPAVALDGKLVAAAQRSLSRLELADLAAALVASAIPAAKLEDVTLDSLAGPEAATVFDTSDGSGLRRLSIPGLYTHAGFNRFFLPQLAALGETFGEDQWVLGAGGEQVAMRTQLQDLGPRLLDRYGQDFLAAWNKALAPLRMRPLADGGPAYPALAATASAQSPLRLLIEGVARETSLTEGDDAAAGAADAERTEEGLRRIGLSLFPAKRQNRAGEASSTGGGVPGAAIEAQFRPYRLVVEGEPGQRPVDLLVRNFSDILQSLVLAANSPAQAERANANLQLQIANLRANASRFPRPITRMAQAAAGEFEGSAAAASITELRDKLEEEVTKPCRAAIAGTYPFERAATRDLPVAVFAAVFAPDRPLDRFFAQNLAQYADTSGAQWQWRQDTPFGRALSPDTLRSFQQAARIRDTFFVANRSQPSLAITITPQSLHGDVDMALMEIGGQIVQSYQAGSVPATVTWPDIATSAVGVNLTPEIPGRPSTVSFSGPWALMRLLDTGAVAAAGDAAQARVVIGGRDVTYALKTAAGNPFLPPGFSEFTCPAGL